jgi:hypothetical protein
MAMPVEQSFNEAAVIVDHVLKVPALLLVIFVRLFGVVRERVLVFVHETAVADVGTRIAQRRQRTMIAAIAPTGLVDEAVVLAMPAFEMAIVIAPPVAVAAIIGAAPPADIEGAVARTIDVVAAVFAIPAVPAAIVVAAETFAAFAMETAASASVPIAAAVAEMDGRHGIEGIEQNGVVERHTAIFVDAAGFTRDRARVQHQACRDSQGREQPEPFQPCPRRARRHATFAHGVLLQ